MSPFQPLTTESALVVVERFAITVRPVGECRITRHRDGKVVTYTRRIECTCGYTDERIWDGVDLALSHNDLRHHGSATTLVTDPSGYRIDTAWCSCEGLGCNRCRVKACDCGTDIPTRLRKCPSCRADARLALPVRVAEPIPTTSTYSSV